MREFTDSAGVAWQVWDTGRRFGALLPLDYGSGWLTFESKLGRYRLAPALPGWESFSVAKLEALCRTARAGKAPRDREG